MPTAATISDHAPKLSAAPPAPATIEDTGLSADQLSQLVLKSLYAGEATGLSLAERMRIPYGILEPLIEGARVERLIEVRGASGTGTAGYRYLLTDAGRERARSLFDVNTYVGPTPVPLTQYTAYMAELRASRG